MYVTNGLHDLEESNIMTIQFNRSRFNMKLRRNTTYSVVFAMLVFTVSIALSGCGGDSALGAGIPSNQSRVALADVVTSPADYHEKTFLVQGNVSSQCASLCDFVLTDGKHSVTIYSQDFKFPKLALGTPVLVYVQATAGERLILSALGMKI